MSKNKEEKPESIAEEKKVDLSAELRQAGELRQLYRERKAPYEAALKQAENEVLAVISSLELEQVEIPRKIEALVSARSTAGLDELRDRLAYIPLDLAEARAKLLEIRIAGQEALYREVADKYGGTIKNFIEEANGTRQALINNLNQQFNDLNQFWANVLTDVRNQERNVAMLKLHRDEARAQIEQEKKALTSPAPKPQSQTPVHPDPARRIWGGVPLTVDW